MNRKYSYTFISLIIAILIVIILFAYPHFEIKNPYAISTNGQPRRYFDYSPELKNSLEIQTFPYLFIAILYLTVQIFVFINIKRVYKSYKRIRLIIYFFCVLISAPFVLIPYLYIIKFKHFFVEGLNPFLGQIIYLPICFQIWIWIDMIIKIIGENKIVKQVE